MQVFHVCESGKRQSSFLCPKGTIFNQKHRVCDWWYNVKCEDSTEFYDLNLDLILMENNGKSRPLPNVPPPIDPFAFSSGNSDDDDFGALLLSDDDLNSVMMNLMMMGGGGGDRRNDDINDISQTLLDDTLAKLSSKPSNKSPEGSLAFQRLLPKTNSNSRAKSPQSASSFSSRKRKTSIRRSDDDFSHGYGACSTSAQFVPPKPNELFISARIGRSCASLGTRFMPSPAGSGSSRLMVGGSTPSRIASTHSTGSRPPAAPRRCPVMLLVLDTASPFVACAP